MLEKIKNYQKHPFVQQFRDVRAVGLAVFGAIALMVTWSGIKAVQTNYSLQKRISKLNQQNEVASLQNTNLKLQNEYYKTDQYLELTARREFGLAAPGEKVILVPEKVALAHAKNIATTTNSDNFAQTVAKSKYRQNFEHWMDFFLHRNSDN